MQIIYPLSHPEKTWRNLKCVFLSKRCQWERPRTIWLQLYDILEKAKLWRWRMSGRQGSGWGGASRWSTDGLQGSETALCEAMMVDTHHHTFVTPTECKLCQLRTLCSISTYQCIDIGSAIITNIPMLIIGDVMCRGWKTRDMWELCILWPIFL